MNDAVVTLDVLHSGVIWGWFVTMNLWAKSIATGVVLLAPWMPRSPRMRLVVAGIGFVFLNVTLLFTVLDLHQPLRFWHMFVHPSFGSIITVGAWILTVYNLLLLIHLALTLLGKEAIYDRLFPLTWLVAFLGTIYTAGLLGQANARETWHAATEVPQMILAATLAGSAVFFLLWGGRRVEAPWLSTVLGGSAALSLVIYLVEIVLAPQKSGEAEHTIGILVSGELQPLFLGGLSLGFAFPALASILDFRRPMPGVMVVASLSSLVGLWMVKHAWLIAPQLVPLS